MNLHQGGLTRGLILSALGFCTLLAGCKDDDPCDPGQIVKNTQCYPAPVAMGGSSGDGGGTAVGDAGAPDAAGGEPSATAVAFGMPCADTTASSDCGGDAPVCADLTPLGQSIMCTQVNCSPGEANADVCPSGFNCFAVPGYPSVCIKN